MRLIYFLFFILISFSAFSQSKVIPVTIDANSVTYSKKTGQVIAKGNVVMKYKGIVLKCDDAAYNTQLNTAYVKGNVKIIDKKGIIKADEADYDFTSKKAQMHNIYANFPPAYGKAKEGEKVSDNEYVLKIGYITTCDINNPHCTDYKIVSKRIVVYPGEKIIAKNIVLKIGDIPIFYLPYYSQSLKDNSFPVELSPGRDSDWGAYVLSRWRYQFNDKNRGEVSLDWYDKRGIGRGISHKFDAGKYGRGLAKVYYINDRHYNKDNKDSSIPDDRYKAQLSYHNRIGKLSLTGEYHKFSDIDFMKDFFYREYEKDTHPLSYFLADYSSGNSSLSLLAQKRINRFFAETEYIPKLEYNFYRHSINGSPFYFESKESLSALTKKYAHSNLNNNVTRFHTHNVLTYEKSIAWLHIAPYAGLYSTFYSRNIYGKSNVWRQAPEAGISLSTKLYRIFPYSFDLLGEKVDKVRHIFTPTIYYSYIHPPTTSRNELTDFDSTDTLEREESMVLELKNKFQAKNNKRAWDILYFNPSLKYTFNKEGKGSYLDSMNTDLEFFPKQGLSLTGDSEYDFVNKSLKEASLDIGLKDKENNKYYAYIGQRYDRGEDSQTTLSFMYQLTPKWQFRSYLRYEYGGEGFQEQQYVIRRELHCWFMDIGLDIDEHSNYTIWTIFRVKAFPRIHVGFDHTYHGRRSSY